MFIAFDLQGRLRDSVLRNLDLFRSRR